MSGLQVDASALADAARRLELEATDAIGDAAQLIVPELADAVQLSVRRGARRHSRTGRLERNVRELDERRGGIRTTARVAATGMVAPIIVGGSRPHTIRPVAREALALAGGARGFAAAVRHPGTSPDPFVARGVADADLEGATDAGAARLVDELAHIAEG